MAWFKTNLLDPFAKAMVGISNERVKIAEKFKEIKSVANIAPSDLSKKIPGEPFTVEQAVRSYVWTQQGMDIPGLSKACLLYTSPSPRDRTRSRMPSSA